MAAIRRWMLATLMVLALLVAGCNGGDDDAGEAATTPPTTAAQTEAPESEAPAPTPTPEPDGSRTYVVKEGDTLSGIAERFDTTVRRIVEANNIKDPDRIKVGRELVIPPPR